MGILFSQVISKSSEVVGDSAVEEKYLIATSEQPLCALHRYFKVYTCIHVYTSPLMCFGRKIQLEKFGGFFVPVWFSIYAVSFFLCSYTILVLEGEMSVSLELNCMLFSIWCMKWSSGLCVAILYAYIHFSLYIYIYTRINLKYVCLDIRPFFSN